MEPDSVEMRVLGCLIEKQRTTPDQYPLTINALRLACNQATNRDPVVEYDEGMVRAALERLGRRRWTRLASWSSSRAMKYRHLLGDELKLSSAELALLAVLMLRGPQTPGELRQRSDRLHAFSSSEEVDATLSGLIERGLAGRLPRRPGQREQRFAQLLGGDVPAELESEAQSAGARPGGEPEPETRPALEPAAPAAVPAAGHAPSAALAEPPPEAGAGQAAASGGPSDGEGLEQRVSELERELADLRGQLRALREELGA